MPRDYLLRLIEQFGLVWRRVLRLHEQQEHQAALDEINTAYGQFFGLNANFIDLLPEDGLIDLARSDEDIDPDTCAILAGLHIAEGDCYAGLARIDEAHRRYDRALMLYAALFAEGGRLPGDQRAPLDRLLAALGHYDLDADGLRRLWRVYAAIGRFDRAENELWHWLESQEFAADPAAEAVRWYNELLEQPDRVLEAGGLPRGEIQASLAELANQA